ncbi:hypothetical protein PoB_000782500 [Plakobranchus ocellatus]|uniref:Uncharacterized protein n=1 Tax=Plakobranchus ocellatus TaxID=259542 RepID=A0AAV3YE50_9GAST|nr:hypothetical protein PoB_000782500 [Plakobranchus ocellatus]
MTEGNRQQPLVSPSSSSQIPIPPLSADILPARFLRPESTQCSIQLLEFKALEKGWRKQRIYTEPALHLDGQPIPVKDIRGNENVDKLAKAALNRTSCLGKLICWSDLKPKVNAYIHTVWQENWDVEGANKLCEVQLGRRPQQKR